jgi:hypothetical protein
MFPREFKARDMSGIIFILGVTLLGVLSLSTPAPLTSHLTAGPGMMPVAGAGMLFLVAGSTQSKLLTIINRIPASAYKAAAPAVIGLLATLVLVMLVVL